MTEFLRVDDAPSGSSTSTTPDHGSAQLGGDTLKALQAAMAAEHAALWSYGLVTASDPALTTTVSDMVTNHQAIRDVTANLLVQGGATPVSPEPAYDTPEPVTDTASALALALTIESDCAMAWRSVIGFANDSTLRGTALSALSDCAMRMVTWRKTRGDSVLTVPFPGDPADN